jgi:hypothetical protein
MVDIIKQDMTDIWASSGDVTAPTPEKIATGWIVEAVPRQWWNWFENRQDTNIAYMLQKGIPEWDIVSEYLTNKSYIQRNNVVYKCIQTNSGQDPATAPLYWAKAFPESSDSLEAIRTLTPAADRAPYYTGTNTAALMTVTAFARTLLDDPNVTTMRATLGAQATHPNLTALSGPTAATNTLPYFNSATTMLVTPFTAFGRSLIDDADAATARATLEVDSAATVAANLAAGLATKQDLDATLTALAGTSTGANTINYWTGVDATTTTPLTAFARTLLDDTDAATMRGTLSVYSIADSDSNLTAGLATKQPLDATLTALAGLATGINQLAYATGTDTFAQTTLTAFARTILDDTDAVTVRGTIGADDAANLTTGVLALARLPANLTGKNAATATALQTPRTIQGVAFDGTANITLSVVDKDSATGSATLPAGTTAQRTASPVNGQLRYNSDNNEFEGYINGAWGGIGGGTPLFTTLWWPSRTAIPAGYVPADGQLLTRTTYAAAWARVLVGDVPIASDATWLASSTSRGCYTSGDGTNTKFRIPDLNGKTAGTLAAPFLRGDGTNSTGVAGQFQGSDNLAHSHTWAATAGAVRNTYPSVVGYSLNTGAVGYADVANAAILNNSGGVEARPVNVTGVYIIKLIGGASDLTKEDASVAVAALEDKLAYVSGRNRIINGDCRLAQRGSSVAVSGTVNLWGGPDRYRATMQAAGGQFTQSASTFVDLNGVTVNWVAQTCNTPATNLAGTNYWSGIAQAIEGTNCFDLRGNPVSISFLFRSNIAGTFTVVLRDSTTWSYASTFTVLANTTTKVVVNIPAIPLATSVPNTAGIGLQVNIGALNNGTFQTATTNAWQNATYLVAAGTTQWQATAGNFIAVTNLQLEKGLDTEFEQVSFTNLIAQCQRYYQTGYSPTGGYGQTIAANQYPVRFGIAMRTTPALSYGGSQSNCSTWDVRNPDSQGFTVLSVPATNGAYAWNPNWTADAEI